MTITEQLDAHRWLCGECTPFHVCRVASVLLAKLGERLAPAPVVLDLEGHKATCTRCTVARLCSDGRAIVKAAGEALLEAGMRPVPA